MTDLDQLDKPARQIIAERDAQVTRAEDEVVEQRWLTDPPPKSEPLMLYVAGNPHPIGYVDRSGGAFGGVHYEPDETDEDPLDGGRMIRLAEAIRHAKYLQIRTAAEDAWHGWSDPPANLVDFVPSRWLLALLDLVVIARERPASTPPASTGPHDPLHAQTQPVAVDGVR